MIWGILNIFIKSRRGDSKIQLTASLLVLLTIIIGGLFFQDIQNIYDGDDDSAINNSTTDQTDQTVSDTTVTETTVTETTVTDQPGILKMGFIYVGPVSSIGWTSTHDRARLIIDEKYDWIETNFIESVVEGDAISSIDFLVDWGADVVITTSFGFMDETINAGDKYPEVIFFHVGGFKRAKNVGTVFADLYQLSYLNGLMAGALSQTDRLGYVAAFPIPEILRQINAFHIGAREVNPSIKTDVEWIFSWFNPVEATASANSLISKGADVLAFNEDTDAVVIAAESEGVYSFSHYTPMQSSGPNAVVSGRLLHWEVLYEEIAVKVFNGDYTNLNLQFVDILGLINDGAVELGSDFGIPINPVFVDALKAVSVDDPVLGAISIYDLVMTRLEQMNTTNVGFDPYTGPLYSQDGTLQLEVNSQMSVPDMFSIDWFVGVDGGCPAASDNGCVIGSSTG